MPERDRAMSERDGTMTDVASTYVLCPRLVSVNFRLRRKEESCGAEVGWCASKCGVMGSKCGATGSKCGARWSKGYCFYLIPNWSLALRQAHLNTGLRRYQKKDYTNKMKSWKDRTIS